MKHNSKRKRNSNAMSVFSWIAVFLFPCFSVAQSDSLLHEATLPNLIQYALVHQPLINQSLLDEQITESTIKSKLADWYPQINFNYNLQHNFQLQQAIIGGNIIKFGVDNTSAFQFTATQNIFNRDALLAKRSADDVRTQVKQNTTRNKIEVVTSVSKAFYSMLTSMQQIKVADEAILRLERSIKDAYSRYAAGIADKTDYKRATISLNNTRAIKKNAEELLKARSEYLKSLIGYPTSASLDIVFDSSQLEKDILIDTAATVTYAKRIEYQLLVTQKKLQEANLRYNKWSYLPAVSAFGAYNLNFQNNSFSKLYSTSFPNSYAGISLSVPVFQGGKRKFNIRAQELQLSRLSFDMISLENNINAQYAQAIAVYKSSLAGYEASKENVQLAQEVYDIINLQYKAGIKTYLEVIIAEAELRTAQINYYNALYELQSGKIDVQKALGDISY